MAGLAIPIPTPFDIEARTEDERGSSVRSWRMLTRSCLNRSGDLVERRWRGHEVVTTMYVVGKDLKGTGGRLPASANHKEISFLRDLFLFKCAKFMACCWIRCEARGIGKSAGKIYFSRAEVHKISQLTAEATVHGRWWWLIDSLVQMGKK
ncbi:hypothetical protein FA15DRAFT_691850 [Coprinopsis marcescibilis]|uniref:Uncharacterized protein n=1 Tax=Coprinopsis marcescibilis TaxID=230819 RepID=A0A5C3LIJ6_COPMA|nr:hypothetical protein FA15DRAFT_691850 [Coprinopsis marcescibilis]